MFFRSRRGRSLRLAGLRGERLDAGHDLLDRRVPPLERLHHLVFRHFLRARLDHHDGFFRACDDEVELRGARLIVSRVDDEAVFDQADAHAGDGVFKRDV